MDLNDLNEINDYYYEFVFIMYKFFVVIVGLGFLGGGLFSNVLFVWGFVFY